MFWLIGIGNQIDDINIKTLEVLKDCDSIYMEYYTSFYSNTLEELEKTIAKSIQTVTREFVEQEIEPILTKSLQKDIALLIIGDPLSATTHIDLLDRCEEKKIPYQIINNISIFSLIARTGLQAYKFGKTTSIPFHSRKFMPRTPIHTLEQNQEIKAHTLFLLDIDPINNEYLKINEAIEFLAHFKPSITEKKIIACSKLGTPNEKILYGPASEIKKKDQKKNLPPPVCLIIPSELHFMEEKYLNKYSL